MWSSMGITRVWENEFWWRFSISLDQYLIFHKVLIIKYWLWIVDIKLVPIFHEQFFAPNKIDCLLDFLLTEGKLLKCVTNYLEYAFGEHGIARFKKVVSAHVKNV